MLYCVFRIVEQRGCTIAAVEGHLESLKWNKMHHLHMVLMCMGCPWTIALKKEMVTSMTDVKVKKDGTVTITKPSMARNKVVEHFISKRHKDFGEAIPTLSIYHCFINSLSYYIISLLLVFN